MPIILWQSKEFDRSIHAGGGQECSIVSKTDSCCCCCVVIERDKFLPLFTQEHSARSNRGHSLFLNIKATTPYYFQHNFIYLSLNVFFCHNLKRKFKLNKREDCNNIPDVCTSYCKVCSTLIKSKVSDLK